MNDLSQTLVDIARAGAALPKVSDFRLLQASGELQYRFEELAIEIEPGRCAGYFNGTAHVTYWNDSEEGLSWFVGRIHLDCVDGNPVELERDHKLYLDVWSELTDGAFKDRIDAQVREQL